MTIADPEIKANVKDSGIKGSITLLYLYDPLLHEKTLKWREANLAVLELVAVIWRRVNMKVALEGCEQAPGKTLFL